MIEYYTLYLPKSNREVKLEISGPRYRNGIKFDTFYFLDGQNAFLDSHAAFGRSIRATKCLSVAAKEMGKRILGIAIHNSGSDLGRVNEYAPFKIQYSASDEWDKQRVKDCMNFCDDFVNTIIPFIEKNYDTYEDMNHRFIYGSSLAANTALYIGFKYKNLFKYIAAFSTATFLFKDELYKFLNKHHDESKDVFIYVGKNESSDDSYDKNLYMDSAKELYDYFKKKKNRVRLSIDLNGIHDEETWGNHLFEFINFIYNEDIFISY